jgi:hypothetical protein
LTHVTKRSIAQTEKKRLCFLFFPKWSHIVIIIVLFSLRIFRRCLKDGFRLIRLVRWCYPIWFFLAFFLVAKQNRARIFLLRRWFLQCDILDDIRRQCTTVYTDTTARTSATNWQIWTFGFNLNTNCHVEFKNNSQMTCSSIS